MSELELLTTGAGGMARERARLEVSAYRVAASQASGAGFGDSLTEMIRMLDAQRAYEASASIFDLGKRIAERTLDVGRL
ncbi:MAG: hypothetical protein JO140_04700 [Candidatus Eremiobacteraeota bacterium]|nr:hypothetical protein [Candidatus Eremiobacteraeota bacterium]